MVSEEQPINKFMKLQKNELPKFLEGKNLTTLSELEPAFDKLKEGKLYVCESVNHVDFWTLFSVAEEITENFKIYRVEKAQFYICEVWKDGR